MNSKKKVKSTLLPIYIVKEDPNGNVIGRKKINFQINYGNVYRISYKYFTPKGYRLAKDSKPEATCEFVNNQLNVKSITFKFVKNGASRSKPQHPTEEHAAQPIHVSYIDVDSNERVQVGMVTGKYDQKVNVLDQVAIPAGYHLCGGQHSMFQIKDHRQSIDLMVKRDPVHHEISRQDSDQTDHTDKVTVKTGESNTTLMDNIKKNIQTLESNLQKYNCDVAVQLVHEILNHDTDFFKNVIMDIFSKSRYKDVDNLKVDPDEHKVSGVIKKCPYNKNHVNFTFVRARKYDIKHQVSLYEVRDFVTSVMDHQCSKGIFITTSRFTPDARKEAEKHSIILIDDMKLAQLMIQNNVGVKPKRLVKIVNLDKDFF